jgi:hypothetical protein
MAKSQIVACRLLLGNAHKQTRLLGNKSTRNNRGTVGNGVFYSGPGRALISRT